jgi:hypothetical protein
VIQRLSSRRQRLEPSFLIARLQGVLAYDRSAGHFSSSILEMAGEALESVPGPVHLVCNSALDARAVLTVRTAARAAYAPRMVRLGAGAPALKTKGRFSRLHAFLASGKLRGLREEPAPAVPIIESPVYRKEVAIVGASETLREIWHGILERTLGQMLIADSEPFRYLVRQP